MKPTSIFEPGCRESLEARVRQLHPESPRQWGRMTPHQAICHLSDGFRMAMGLTPVVPIASRFKPVVRAIALYLPMAWPRGIGTFPELRQGAGGTPPGEFEADRAELLALMTQFCSRTEADLAPSHGMFGPMRRSDWGRWAVRHVDHHLRQFGA